MFRWTEKDMEDAVKELANLLGVEYTGDKIKIGGWRLRYDPSYGGAMIEEYISERGAVSRPFGERRYPPAEFIGRIEFALSILKYPRKTTTERHIIQRRF